MPAAAVTVNKKKREEEEKEKEEQGSTSYRQQQQQQRDDPRQAYAGTPGSPDSARRSGGGGSKSLLCASCEDKLPYQSAVRTVYQRGATQSLVAVLIVANFIVTVVEKEIDPYAEDLQFHRRAWFLLDQLFTWAFLVELLVNIYGSWMCAFWQSGWNWFDFIIVTISVLSSVGALKGPLKLLKTFRAFRVFRLFKRVKALNKIIVALIRAIPGAKQRQQQQQQQQQHSSSSSCALCRPLHILSRDACMHAPCPHTPRTQARLRDLCA